ncbi:MAG: RNA ligase family protein [Candidatus Woesearchaeota archaeon]
MTHLKYSKIHRLGKEEVNGILEHIVTVQEKIDGANTSVWIENGELKLGSRRNEVEDFRGLRDYIENHEGILKLLNKNPNFRLFGEWLVPHTIKYDKKNMNHFYLFDIYNHKDDVWYSPSTVRQIAKEHNINFPKVFVEGEHVKEEQLKEFLGDSEIGEKGEGIVIKSPDFVNKFGNNVYAKMVTKDFEEQNKAVFGGNSKHNDNYYEQKIVNEYITENRVNKIMQKISSQTGRQLDYSDTPRICQTVYHDMLTEEIWSIQKKVPEINFSRLKKTTMNKSKVLYHKLLEEQLLEEQ